MYNTSRSGMTLLEVIVAMSIFSILMLAVFVSTTQLYRQNAYAIEQTEEVNNARRGMTQWNRDVKEMTTGEDGTYPIAVIEEHRLGYYSDTDQDAEVEYVEYVLASTTLTKYTYKATGTPATYSTTTPDLTEVLSLYVQNIEQGTTTFLYYDNAGTQLSSTSPIIDVRFITAQLIVNIDPDRNPGEFLLRSSLAPRNLKDNL
jgi:prepilin-type N-terminal cleavage/methylation domain-containing protein